MQGEGRHVGAYDPVDAQLFEDQEQALAWVVSEDATAAHLHLAGLVAGTTRHLAVERVVLDVTVDHSREDSGGPA